MLSMLCLVVVFGVHSTVDWTWFVPGDACVALLCAGWLAGRGPLRDYERVAGGPEGLDRGAACGGPDGRAWLRLHLGELGPLRIGIAVGRRRRARCSPPGRSGSRSARPTPPRKRWL